MILVLTWVVMMGGLWEAGGSGGGAREGTGGVGEGVRGFWRRREDLREGVRGRGSGARGEPRLNCFPCITQANGSLVPC